MVEEKPEPVLTLPPEMKDRLTALRADVRKARHGIKVMKELGMDVADIEGKLDWAESVRTTLLKEFT